MQEVLFKIFKINDKNTLITKSVQKRSDRVSCEYDTVRVVR